MRSILSVGGSVRSKFEGIGAGKVGDAWCTAAQVDGRWSSDRFKGDLHVNAVRESGLSARQRLDCRGNVGYVKSGANFSFALSRLLVCGEMWGSKYQV